MVLSDASEAQAPPPLLRGDLTEVLSRPPFSHRALLFFSAVSNGFGGKGGRGGTQLELSGKQLVRCDTPQQPQV